MNSRFDRRAPLKPVLMVLGGMALVSLLCAAFWPFIAAEIVAPLALLAWLLLRVFVLSVGQQTYWYGAAFVVLFSLFRFWPNESAPPPYEKPGGMNVALKNFDRWYTLFSLSEHDPHSIRSLRWELVRLLLSLYATQQHAEADLRLHEALQRREIPLPETLHAFLFPPDPVARPMSFLRRLGHGVLAPWRWLRRSAMARREREACLRCIEETLGFIETSLEMNDDDGRRNTDRN